MYIKFLPNEYVIRYKTRKQNRQGSRPRRKPKGDR